MTTITREEARTIVEGICENNGGISNAEREELSKSGSRYLRILDNLRGQLGSSIQTLATDLYEKDSHFVFELIQNAEDNDYSIANADPFLTFKLFPNEIIVDSNEDGFKEENVKSICEVAKSTKKEQRGYIGEKGIGFKSVFRVASDVHIQSGPWSFFFEHNRGDSGIGMVTPFHREHDTSLPLNVRTRIRLRLAATTDIDSLVNEVSGLPDSLLMFLSKIRKLTVITFSADESMSKTIYSYHYHDEDRRGILTKFTEATGSPTRETIYRYHITKRTLRNLPKATARPKTTEVEVVLAFPIDPDAVPVIEQQHVFAFLPVQRAGFSFQIQSDFIMSATREGIPHSPWNRAILSGIAEAFRDAVLQFCQHPTLQYQWMRYLPAKDISGEFWTPLLPHLIRLLKEESILRPRSGGPLKTPCQLKWQTYDSVDQYGDPLFDDLANELYLSPHYSWEDKQGLDQLGVQIISFSEILDRVQADLRSPNSKMKSPRTGDDWHTRSARLLMRAFDNGLVGKMNWVRVLDLVPLQDDSWVSSNMGPIFNPFNGTVPIPTDLGLPLVKAGTLENQSRKLLFTKLGLKDCLPATVCSKIFDRYGKGYFVGLESSVTHLQYLYWYLPIETTELSPFIYLKDQNGDAVYRRYVTNGKSHIVDDLYFESEDEYGPKKILSQVTKGDQITAPGYPIHFINCEYLRAVLAVGCRNDISWEDWLVKFAKVQHVPRLAISSGTRLSSVFDYIVEHRRDKIIGVLKAHWSSYKSMKDELKAVLSQVRVTCEDVPDTVLEDTYMPTQDLKQICNAFGVAGKLPFLKIPPDLNKNLEEDWTFLKTFNVGFEAGLDFYLKIIQEIVRSNKKESTLSVEITRNLFAAYREIGRYDESAERKKIRAFFSTETAVYFQGFFGVATWARPTECVWKAPNFYNLRRRLAELPSYHGDDRLRHLFCDVLKIKDANFVDFVKQATAEKTKNTTLTTMIDIYRHIQLSASDEDDWEHVCTEFEDQSLIYDSCSHTWHSPSSCLWTDSTRILGKTAIANQYPKLKDLFVTRLSVSEPDLSMVINTLVHVAKNRNIPPFQQVRDLIRDITFWSLGATSLDDLRLCNVLPVKGTDGQLALKNSTDIFAIVDRLEYGELFKDKLPVLDFDLEDIHALQPFLFALSLRARYMSQLIKETSTVNGCRIDVVLSNEMRKKAHALLRCAVHFGLTQWQHQSVYSRLQNISVYRSSGIKKSITVNIETISVTVEGASCTLHIADENDQLRLYVPVDEDEREICYLDQIPAKLLAYLAITNPAAVEMIGNVIKASRSSLLDRLLRDRGIVQVPGVEYKTPPVLEDPSNLTRAELPGTHTEPTTLDQSYLSPQRTSRRQSTASTYDEISSSTSTTHRHSSSSRGYSTPTSSFSSRVSGTSRSSRSPDPSISTNDFSPSNSFTLESRNRRRYLSPEGPRVRGQVIPEEALSRHSRTIPPSPLFQPSTREGEAGLIPVQATSNDEYRNLLHGVIAAAASASLPSFAPTAAAHTTDHIILSDTVFGNRSADQMSHDMKIGAAGELYAFELLYKQNLNDFGWHNWRSTIRKYVCVHEKYRDMEPWRGRETADIVYEDVGPEYRFTALLARLGYLRAGNPSPGTVLTYYLEVKTTPHECDTRFYMSKAQYSRMKAMTMSRERPATDIYIIMRVFNMGQNNIGMRLYIDPATMELEGKLKFEPDHYVVTPGPTVEAAMQPDNDEEL